MQTNIEVSNDWERLVKEYKNSGLTKKSFCEKNGIKGHQLYYFENKLNNKKCIEKKQVDLIPIKIKTSSSSDVSHSIEFILKNGTKCLLSNKMPEEELQKIIKALSSC